MRMKSILCMSFYPHWGLLKLDFYINFYCVLSSTHEYFCEVLRTYLSTFIKWVLSTYSSTFQATSTQYLLEYWSSVHTPCLVPTTYVFMENWWKLSLSWNALLICSSGLCSTFTHGRAQIWNNFHMWFQYNIFLWTMLIRQLWVFRQYYFPFITQWHWLAEFNVKELW